MTSKVSTTGFSSDAEVLMVLFNNIGSAASAEPARPTITLEEAMKEVSTKPRLITHLHSMKMMLYFDGTNELDCSAYEEANGMSVGRAQEVLDTYLMDKSRQLMLASA